MSGYTPYHFAFNNPVQWKDPSGLYPVENEKGKKGKLQTSDNPMDGTIERVNTWNAMSAEIALYGEDMIWGIAVNVVSQETLYECWLAENHPDAYKLLIAMKYSEASDSEAGSGGPGRTGDESGGENGSFVGPPEAPKNEYYGPPTPAEQIFSNYDELTDEHRQAVDKESLNWIHEETSKSTIMDIIKSGKQTALFVMPVSKISTMKYGEGTEKSAYGLTAFNGSWIIIASEYFEYYNTLSGYAIETKFRLGITERLYTLEECLLHEIRHVWQNFCGGDFFAYGNGVDQFISDRRESDAWEFQNRYTDSKYGWYHNQMPSEYKSSWNPTLWNFWSPDDQEGYQRFKDVEYID